MTIPAALADVRDQRPEALDELGKLANVVEQIDATRAVTDRLLAERRSLWKRARQLNPPVSWADLARVSGTSEVTVIQAVQGRTAKKR